MYWAHCTAQRALPSTPIGLDSYKTRSSPLNPSPWLSDDSLEPGLILKKPWLGPVDQGVDLSAAADSDP